MPETFLGRPVLRHSPARIGPSKRKAAEILADGTVHGEPLTGKQKSFMRAVAHGFTPTGKKRR